MLSNIKKWFGVSVCENIKFDQRIAHYTREIPDKIREEKENFVNLNTRITHLVEVVPQDNINILSSKLGGKPFWSDNLERPKCNKGHYHSFIAQVLTDDVSDFPKDKVICFHYCAQCSMDGDMAWGYSDTEKDRYAVTILDKNSELIYNANDPNVDILAPIEEGKMSFTSVVETITVEEAEVISKSPNIDDIIRLMIDDLDVEGMIYNHSQSKFGGYASWLQSYEPPGDDYQFVFQLGMEDSGNAPWCNGCVYIFVDFNTNTGEMILQTT